MTSKDAIFHLSPHLLYPDNHFAPASQHLLHPVEELEEEFLASEDEAGSMSLADEDAALAETERTIARLEHGARKGMKLIQAPEPMMLALQAAALTGFGKRKRGRRARRARGGGRRARGGRRRGKRGGRGVILLLLHRLQEHHLAGETAAFSHHNAIFTRLQAAPLALYCIANMLVVNNSTLAIYYFLTEATHYGATNCTKTI